MKTLHNNSRWCWRAVFKIYGTNLKTNTWIFCRKLLAHLLNDLLAIISSSLIKSDRRIKVTFLSKNINIENAQEKLIIICSISFNATIILKLILYPASLSKNLTSMPIGWCEKTEVRIFRRLDHEQNVHAQRTLSLRKAFNYKDIFAEKI